MSTHKRPIALGLSGAAVLLTVAIASVVPSQQRLLVLAGGVSSAAIGAAVTAMWGRKPSQNTQQSVERIKAGLILEAEKQTGLEFPNPERFLVETTAEAVSEQIQPQQQPIQQPVMQQSTPVEMPVQMPKMDAPDPWVSENSLTTHSLTEPLDNLF